MQKHTTDGAISIEHTAASVAYAAEDDKMTARDLLAVIQQVAAAMAFCGLVGFVF